MKTIFHTRFGSLAVRVFAILLLSISAPRIQAQISTQLILGLDTSALNATDTNIYMVIENLDSAAYTGYINVYYSTDIIAFTPVLFCSLPSVTVQGQDTISLNCSIFYDSTYFNTGDNIVVVWSSGNAKYAADTLWDSVYLKPDLASVHDLSDQLYFSISPSPATDFIQINLESSKKPLPDYRVLVRDVFGKLLMADAPDNSPHHRMDVGHLPAGVYFLELLFADRSRAFQKFVKVD